MSSGRVYFMTQKALLATKTQLWMSGAWWPLHYVYPRGHHSHLLQLDVRLPTQTFPKCTGEHRVVSVERVNGGRGQRDAFTSPSPRLTRERGEGGILIDTLQNLGLHSFLTQDAFAHLNSRGRSAKFKYLKESELTCWADKHFVTKEKVKF